jgi:Putative metallopeptidase
MAPKGLDDFEVTMKKIAILSLAPIAVLVAWCSGSVLHAQTANEAWQMFLNGGQPDLQPNRIRVQYDEPTDPQLRTVYEIMMRRKPLHKVQEIFSPLRLPIDLTVKTTQCGMSNAWYRRPEVTLCYEYLRELRDMAPTETSPDGVTPVDAVVGEFLFTASHEVGHAVFDLLDVPLFGRPEDDADQFAAHVLIRIGKNNAPQLIHGAAYMYAEYIKRPTVTVPVAAFADVHGAPVQRLYNLLCLAYGADPVMFADVVEKGYLPKSRVPACKTEWGEVDFAFQKLIYPYIDRTLLNEMLSKSWVPYANIPIRRQTDTPQSMR